VDEEAGAEHAHHHGLDDGEGEEGRDGCVEGVAASGKHLDACRAGQWVVGHDDASARRRLTLDCLQVPLGDARVCQCCSLRIDNGLDAGGIIFIIHTTAGCFDCQGMYRLSLAEN
jgi:hypothetical protein